MAPFFLLPLDTVDGPDMWIGVMWSNMYIFDSDISHHMAGGNLNTRACQAAHAFSPMTFACVKVVSTMRWEPTIQGSY